jgi:hypothetical protein
MISQRKLWLELSLWFRHVQSAVAEALSEAPLYELFGGRLTRLLSSLTFTVFISLSVTDLASRWQSDESAGGFHRVQQHPWWFLSTLALLALWVYGLSRFFQFIGWPRGWALPAVFLVLLPWAWLCSDWRGTSFIVLVLLQSPVIVAYVWRTPHHAKQKN